MAGDRGWLIAGAKQEELPIPPRIVGNCHLSVVSGSYGKVVFTHSAKKYADQFFLNERVRIFGLASGIGFKTDSCAINK